MKWARMVAKKKILGATTLLVVASLITSIISPMVVHADPTTNVVTSAKWINRFYLVDNFGHNYFDQDPYDGNYEYVQQGSNGCPNKIVFQYPGVDTSGGTNGNDGPNLHFFYDDTNYKNNWKAHAEIGTDIAAGSGQTQCTRNDTVIPTSSIDNRRILFYRNQNDQIISIPSGITFSRKGSFVGNSRYFRDDEVSDSSNSCPDMIISHPAQGGDGTFGGNDIPNSSILFAVTKDNSLNSVSESYALDSAPNNITPKTCYSKGDDINKKKGGPYALGSYSDNGNDQFFRSAGLNSGGQTGGGDYSDDAWIIFVGTMDNLPKDASGNPITTPTGNNSDKLNGQTCKGGALGWIICPIVSAIQTTSDFMRDAMQQLLTVNPLPIDSNAPIYQIWNNFRNFANIFFVIVFFIIIFSQATSIGISNYGIKKMLPMAVVAIVASNLSYYFCSVAVDVFNILGVGIYNLIGIANGGSSGTVDISNGAGAIFIGALTAAITAAIATGQIVEIFGLIVTAFLAMLVTFLILVARQGLLVVITDISAFIPIMLIIAGLRSTGKRVLDIYIALLLMYPGAMFIFGGVRLASAILTATASGTNLGTWVSVAALVLQILAGFAVIFLFNGALAARAALGKLSGRLSGATKSFSNRANERARQSGFYQRRDMARNQRRQERQRSATEGYAEAITGGNGSRWARLRARRLQQRAGGMLNAAGQQRAYVSGLGQVEKLESQETKDAQFVMEKSGITSPRDWARLAAGQSVQGANGAVVDGSNVAVQRAAMQRIIQAQDSEQLENMFMDDHVNQEMLHEEVQKNFAGVKAAGAHLVKLDVKRDSQGRALRDTNGNLLTYSQDEMRVQAARALADLSPEKLAGQDSRTLESAMMAMHSGMQLDADPIRDAAIKAKLQAVAQSVIDEPLLFGKAKGNVQEDLRIIVDDSRFGARSRGDPDAP